MAAMDLRLIVLVKQVPDTKNITAEAMKEDGTVNRQALPAVFNPEDLNALELALWVRDCYGGRVTVMTMGPPTASEVLREALYRAANQVVLITDPRFAAADTLATSYTLAQAIRKLGRFDIVFCGRQAIDGDTAQVGPQTAEKLAIPQVTYVKSFDYLESNQMIVRRDLEFGYEQVLVPVPALLTVTHTAAEPRPPSAKRLMRFKRARSPFEVNQEVARATPGMGKAEREKLVKQECERLREAGLLITQWSADDIDVEKDRIGLPGSPTKVKSIETVVLTGGECQSVDATEGGIRELVRELIADHTLS